MKKTYYLFNPGVLERRDNTLKFTPITEEDAIPATDAQVRYLPVEDISEFYAFGSLKELFRDTIRLNTGCPSLESWISAQKNPFLTN